MPCCLNPFTQQIYSMDLYAIWHCASFFSHLISIWTPSPCDNKQTKHRSTLQPICKRQKKKTREQKNSTEWDFIISTLSEEQKQGNGVTYLIIPLAGVELCIRMGADLGPSQSDRLQTGREMLRPIPPRSDCWGTAESIPHHGNSAGLLKCAGKTRQQCGKWPRLTAIRWTSTAAALSVMQIQ